MKDLCIMVVCGFGLGTSTILKITHDKVLKEAGIKVEAFTLSADHRVVDGVAAAKFLNDIREYLEQPEILAL